MPKTIGGTRQTVMLAGLAHPASVGWHLRSPVDCKAAFGVRRCGKAAIEKCPRRAPMPGRSANGRAPLRPIRRDASMSASHRDWTAKPRGTSTARRQSKVMRRRRNASTTTSRCPRRRIASSLVLVAEIDPPFREVIDRQFQRDAISRENAYAMPAHLTRRISAHHHTVVERDAVTAIRQDFIDDPVEFDQFFFGHARFLCRPKHRFAMSGWMEGKQRSPCRRAPALSGRPETPDAASFAMEATRATIHARVTFVPGTTAVMRRALSAHSFADGRLSLDPCERRPASAEHDRRHLPGRVPTRDETIRHSTRRIRHRDRRARSNTGGATHASAAAATLATPSAHGKQPRAGVRRDFRLTRAATSSAAASAEVIFEPGFGPSSRVRDRVRTQVESGQITAAAHVVFAAVRAVRADARVRHVFAVCATRRGVDQKHRRIETHHVLVAVSDGVSCKCGACANGNRQAGAPPTLPAIKPNRTRARAPMNSARTTRNVRNTQ
ncbi:hypothetical protein BMA10399_C0060 [Burkholderia mallei ATCC 10399]|nr:hypothetical protein BMA10399_C0060 [Burkholderia mallei ATCC 10399]